MIKTVIVHVLMKVTPESLAEWGSRQAHLNEMGNFLIESTDAQISRSLSEELRRFNLQWAEFIKRHTFVSLPSKENLLSGEQIIIVW